MQPEWALGCENHGGGLLTKQAASPLEKQNRSFPEALQSSASLGLWLASLAANSEGLATPCFAQDEEQGWPTDSRGVGITRRGGLGRKRHLPKYLTQV